MRLLLAVMRTLLFGVMMWVATACDESRSYCVLASTAAQEGVEVIVGEPPHDDGDFAYTIRNASVRCIEMDRLSLPRGGELFLDSVLELVDENGRRVSRRTLGYPIETAPQTLRLEPGDEITEVVNLKQIFGVSRLDGHVAALTLLYFHCDNGSPADVGTLRVQDIRFERSN